MASLNSKWIAEGGHVPPPDGLPMCWRFLHRKYVTKASSMVKDNIKKTTGDKDPQNKKPSKSNRKTPKIISVSRRTDIPACYSDWFFNRIKQGAVQVKKNVGSKATKKVSLAPEDVRCFVFWTKNPGPMLDRLDELKKYQFYFHFTLTPYDQTIESFLPSKKKLLETFIQLSKKIGKEKVIWRYDPILFNEKIDIGYHKKHFSSLAESLYGYTDKCILSFIDSYQISAKNKAHLKLKKITEDAMRDLGKKFQSIGKKSGIKIETCAEKIDLTQFDITPAKCIDPRLIGTISGENLSIAKDPSQRKACGCVKSIDIGTDNTCTHGCLFCYATKDQEQARFNYRQHDKQSPLLIGKISRTMKIDSPSD